MKMCACAVGDKLQKAVALTWKVDSELFQNVRVDLLSAFFITVAEIVPQPGEFLR